MKKEGTFWFPLFLCAVPWARVGGAERVDGVRVPTFLDLGLESAGRVRQLTV